MTSIIQRQRDDRHYDTKKKRDEELERETVCENVTKAQCVRRETDRQRCRQ